MLATAGRLEAIKTILGVGALSAGSLGHALSFWAALPNHVSSHHRHGVLTNLSPRRVMHVVAPGFRARPIH